MAKKYHITPHDAILEEKDRLQGIRYYNGAKRRKQQQNRANLAKIKATVGKKIKLSDDQCPEGHDHCAILVDGQPSCPILWMLDVVRVRMDDGTLGKWLSSLEQWEATNVRIIRKQPNRVGTDD
jgi:hypothetical protein